MSEGKLSRLTAWYGSLSKKKHWIVLASCLLASAIPIGGWVGIAPWMIPLILYLEFHRN